MTKTVLIMAGGTGGHVFPALALAQKLTQAQHKIHWLGTTTGIESRLVPQAGYPLHYLSVRGLRGKGISSLLLAPWRLTKSLFEAVSTIRKIRPQLVVGLGGYASGPGGLAAKLLRLPLVIHEQNATPGTTNRLLSSIADRVLTAFPNTLSGASVIGNPVRETFHTFAEPAARLQQRADTQRVRILVLGGSLGASFINETLPTVFEEVNKHCQIEVWHQTGAKHVEVTQQAYQKNTHWVRIDGFLDAVDEALAWADLVICRSGALTVSELASLGVASILIPFPHAIDDHQTKNAKFLVDAGAAWIQQQKDFDQAVFTKNLTALVGDREKLLDMARSARTVAKPEATQTFYQVCEELMHV